MTDGAALANGTYQMEFKLFDAESAGAQIGSTITNNSGAVVNGVFTVSLNFTASPFAAGANRWLEIGIRKASDPPGFTTLTPRQPITSSPYSLRTISSSAADALSAACVTGVTDSQINTVSGSKITGAATTSESEFSSRLATVRYHANGTLDTKFGTGGKVLTVINGKEGANSIAVKTDGKIVIAGRTFLSSRSDIAVVQYNTDGSLDTNFDNAGIVTTRVGSSFADARSVAVQPDGKVVVGGNSAMFPNDNFAVVCYNSNGSSDNNLGTAGIVQVDLGRNEFASSVKLQTDGKIFASGTKADAVICAVRLTGDSPIPAAANLAGQIVNSQGHGVYKARLTLTNLQTGETKILSTNPFGSFQFTNLPTDNIYRLTIADKRYQFTENVQTFRLLEDKNGLLFAPNNRQNFVRNSARPRSFSARMT